MGKDWMVLLQQQNQLEKVMQTNRTTEWFCTRMRCRMKLPMMNFSIL